MLEPLQTKIKNFHQQHHQRIEIALFIGGFCFDAIMVKEPDELFALFQQVFYLWAIAAILHFELLFSLQRWTPSGRWQKLWGYREYIQPFLLGTLLNIYSIFYIKSASFFSSLIFLIIMIVLIILNEHPKVKKSQVSFKVGLYGICLFSFFAILFPILLGFIGWIPFTLALLSTAGFFYLQFRLLSKAVSSRGLALRAVLFPGMSVIVFFLLFYGLGWIPPVPLNVKEQGVYHGVEKRGDQYNLLTQAVWWKFWQSSDEDFLARAGDKVYFYAQIYSPTRFSDEIYIHWFFKNQRHVWESRDRIPFRIVGGRKEGFRGFATKSNYQAGDWRVQVETSTGLEISRLYFKIKEDPDATGPREFKTLRRD